MRDDFHKIEAQKYKRLLLALMLSNQNKGFKVMDVHLANEPERDWEVCIGEITPSRDMIIFARKKSVPFEE